MSWQKEKDQLGKEIIEKLYEKGMIKTWYRDKPEGWKLVSGIWSPLYINLRSLCSHPELLKKVGNAMGKLIRIECKEINKIVGIAMAGIPISTSISLMEQIPSCFTRKLEGVKTIEHFEKYLKNYGEHSMIEGELGEGDNIVFIDDLVTRFDSKLIAVKQLELEIKIRKINKIKYNNVGVLFDREQNAKESAAKLGISLHALIPFKSKGIGWLRNKFNSIELEVINDYLNNSKKYQNNKKIEELYKIGARKEVHL